MLSIIIIGRNEGWKLSKCLESVFKTVNENNITDFEVIYVDSKSNDKSLEIAKEFPQTKIFQLTSDYNPAIARNVGANESMGEILLFIDGDMELISENFSDFYVHENGIFYPFLSGNFENYFYNQNWEFLKKEIAFKKDEDIFTAYVGGLFFIKKELWNSVGGMRNIFRKGQDVDMSVRLAQKGTKLLRKSKLLAYHHMIPYLDKKRKWQTLFRKESFYGRALLYRKNFLNIYALKRMLRNDYSFIAFTLSLIFIPFFSYYGFICYFFLILFRSLLKKRDFSENVLYFFIKDLITLGGILFFFPRLNEVKYIKIT